MGVKKSRSLSLRIFIFLKIFQSKKDRLCWTIHQDSKEISENFISKVFFIIFTKMSDLHCNGQGNLHYQEQKYIPAFEETLTCYRLLDTLSCRPSSVLRKSIVRSYSASSSHQSKSRGWNEDCNLVFCYLTVTCLGKFLENEIQIIAKMK